jgi:hypothetical protein
LKSYLLGRLIDFHIQHELKQSSDQQLHGKQINIAVRRAEWEFQQIDFKKDIEDPMIEAGWSLEFIYLDQNTNRFMVQKPG